MYSASLNVNTPSHVPPVPLNASLHLLPAQVNPLLQQNVFPAPLNISSQPPATLAPVLSQEHSLLPPAASHSFVTAPHD